MLELIIGVSGMLRLLQQLEEAKKREGLEAEENDADAKEERIQRIKEKMSLQREQEDEDPLLLSEDEEEVKKEDKSKYDTELEEERTVMLMLNSVFVPKSGRDAIAERERLEDEEWALEESRKKKLKERKRESKQIVVEEIWKDKGLDQEANIVADIDTDDEVNEAKEYEAWKARGIVRIKSDREDREAMLKEKEIEKVRNMTDEPETCTTTKAEVDVHA